MNSRPWNSTEVHPILGNPDLRGALYSMRVSYLILPTRAAFLRSVEGRGAVDRLAEGLGEEARRYLLEKPDAFSRYTIGPLLEVDQAILDTTFRGDVERFKALGGHNAESHLKGVLRAFLWMAGNPKMVLRRLVSAFPKYYEGGEAHVDEEHDLRMVFHGGGVLLPHHFCHQLLPGWCERATELAGAKQPEVRHVECRHHGAEVCRWEIAWR